MKKSVVIAVIDSGIDIQSPVFADGDYNGITIKYDNSKFETYSSFDDENGHGTGVCSLLKKGLSEYQVPCNLFIVKIFEKEFSTNEEKLIYALQYIYENIQCDIIQLSNGITYCYSISELHDICLKLYNKGIILVSAFDNAGAVSYPACFDEVIGVDINDNCKKNNEWIYFENSIINIGAKSGIHKCYWLNNEKMIVEGSSFSCVYITAFIANYIYRNENYSLCIIKEQLKKHSKYIENFIISPSKHQQYKAPRKAVVFPFNKEIHALRRYENMLDFEIVNYYDIIYSGNINKICDIIIGGCVSCDESIIIKNIEILDWETDFDTFILGHTQELNKLVNKNIQEEIVNKCCIYNKNLFSFDKLDEYQDLINKYSGINFYSPNISMSDLCHNTYGKLYKIGKPIIGIFGTSSKQGKFTLQLDLRNRFIKEGYKVGQLGTEPHSELFGFDFVFPMGYNSNINIDYPDYLKVINNIIHNIELKSPDVIIIGSQSSTIPYDYGNIRYFSDYQQPFLYATVPDCIILLINMHDDIDYIQRTIHYLNSISVVIALVIYPIFIKSSLGRKHFISSDINFDEYKKTLSKNFELPMYILSKEGDMKLLFMLCENYLSDE